MFLFILCTFSLKPVWKLYSVTWKVLLTKSCDPVHQNLCRYQYLYQIWVCVFEQKRATLKWSLDNSVLVFVVSHWGLFVWAAFWCNRVWWMNMVWSAADHVGSAQLPANLHRCNTKASFYRHVITHQSCLIWDFFTFSRSVMYQVFLSELKFSHRWVGCWEYFTVTLECVLCWNIWLNLDVSVLNEAVLFKHWISASFQRPHLGLKDFLRKCWNLRTLNKPINMSAQVFYLCLLCILQPLSEPPRSQDTGQDLALKLEREIDNTLFICCWKASFISWVHDDSFLTVGG